MIAEIISTFQRIIKKKFPRIQTLARDNHQRFRAKNNNAIARNRSFYAKSL